ncbi:MAG: polysaccharide deacetylase family protein [Eubacteriales bacterium]|nr:polysaccharide deacetylase family protein [Eubacteriales bacterium]
MVIRLNLQKIFLWAAACVALFLFALGCKNMYEKVQAASTGAKEGIFLPVIMYHGIHNTGSDTGPYIISADTLGSDLKYLKENGYTAVLMQDLMDYISAGTALPQKPVMITFDDGQLNNMVYAVPLLEKYGMKAIFSVVGSFSEKAAETSDHNASYSYLTWDEIAELSKLPYIEIANHTYEMHAWGTRLGCMRTMFETAEEYEKKLWDDVTKLQNTLAERCGVLPVTFTYPYGLTSPGSEDALKEMGFCATMICRESPNYITRDPDELYRLNRYNRAGGLSTADFMAKALRP